MKTMVVCAFAVVSLFSLGGCSHQSPAPAVPSNQATDLSVAPSSVMEVRCITNPDGFSKTGEVVGDVGRWSYNEATKAFDWITSDANKQRLSNAYQTSKDVAQKAYDKAIETYKEHSDKK
jgi:hypothetical protein